MNTIIQYDQCSLYLNIFPKIFSAVTVSDGGEDGDDEEDGLAVVPADAVLLTHDVDAVVCRHLTVDM